jgi:hypothetical protein
MMFGELPVAVHEKFVPDTFEVRLILGDVPEQICEDNGLFDTSGLGLTVTT